MEVFTEVQAAAQFGQNKKATRQVDLPFFTQDFLPHQVFTGPPQPAGHHQCAILQEACWSLASIVHWRVPGVGLLPSPSLLSSFGLHQVVAWRIV